MARIFITLKVMPDSPEADLMALQKEAEGLILKHGADPKIETTIEPVAFGLQALLMKFSIDEAKGSADPIAEAIEGLNECQSASVIAVSRAFG